MARVDRLDRSNANGNRRPKRTSNSNAAPPSGWQLRVGAFDDDYRRRARVHLSERDVKVWAPAISNAWKKFEIESLNARAGYLGIVGNETGGLVRVKREDMHYSAERAAEVFKKARVARGPAPSEICKQKVAAGHVAFANWIYADVNGSGNETIRRRLEVQGRRDHSQLIGRANYRPAGCARRR